ncbi:MAG: acylneuraminate cytidylyltransferase [Deltaproteobacteria bacterium]|nr:MAG: acylneuraminate cytidylyltransferase [Deltaproteobacteria bacterium]
MYENSNILAVIPARGGSKRIPGKNVKILGDKPLISWTIEAAQQSSFIDKLILSTDDASIAEIAMEYGCEVPFMRPRNLATDDARSEEVAFHALEALGDEYYDYMILLQPTSPFRSSEDIDRAVEVCLSEGYSSLVSTRSVRENPSWMYTSDGRKLLSLAEHLEHIVHRPWQILNGAIYLFNVLWFMKSKTFIDDQTYLYPMPWERSVDVDTAEDWAWAEFLKRHL